MSLRGWSNTEGYSVSYWRHFHNRVSGVKSIQNVLNTLKKRIQNLIERSISLPNDPITENEPEYKEFAKWLEEALSLGLRGETAKF